MDPVPAAGGEPAADLAASRRKLLVAGTTIATYAVPVGLVYGLATLHAGFSLADTFLTSVIVLAGGAQFAAVGLVAGGASWLAIVGVTALLNARHLLYSAALAPYVAERSRTERAAMGHFLTDETFALALTHFRRLGRFDARGYWMASALIFFPWTIGSALGYISGQVADTRQLGLDILFPAAMAGLSVGMMTGRREVAAACAAVVISVVVSRFTGTAVGLVLGAVLGPLAGMILPGPALEPAATPEQMAGDHVETMP